MVRRTQRSPGGSRHPVGARRPRAALDRRGTGARSQLVPHRADRAISPGNGSGPDRVHHLLADAACGRTYPRRKRQPAAIAADVGYNSRSGLQSRLQAGDRRHPRAVARRGTDHRGRVLSCGHVARMEPLRKFAGWAFNAASGQEQNPNGLPPTFSRFRKADFRRSGSIVR